MKLNHEFETKAIPHIHINLSEIFPCFSFMEYMDKMKAVYSSNYTIKNSYPDMDEFCNDAFGILSEAYIRFFCKKMKLNSIECLHKDSKVKFIAKNDNGQTVTFMPLYVESDREITMNKDHISQFANNSQLDYFVPVTANKLMNVFTCGTKVNESLMKDNVVFREKINFILRPEIEENITNNNEFWTSFANSLTEQEIISNFTKYTLRDFQNEAVFSMMDNNIGQIIMPTGTGKSVIQADYVLKEIQQMKKDNIHSPVVLILSPRIVLSYQLLNVVFNHLTHNGISAQYANLSSGDVDEIGEEMRKKLISKGMLPNQIESTTNMGEINKMHADAVKNSIPFIVSATYHSGWMMSELNSNIDIALYDAAHNMVDGRMPEDFKKESMALESGNKFFFTATPCETNSPLGRGMDNVEKFGKKIFIKRYAEMIKRNEILPIAIILSDVENVVLLKNKQLGITPDNIKDADFDRDCTVKAKSISKDFAYHCQLLKEQSCSPENIDGKLLITVNGLATLKGIIASEEIQKMMTEGVKVFAISTELKF